LTIPKAAADDFAGRFREIISDPLNLLIDRHPLSGHLTSDQKYVHLHNCNIVPWEGEGAYYGSFSSILIYNSGVHEPLEEFVFQEVLKTLPEDALMLELGAYWGHYSMWLKSRLPNARVVLVEADPLNLEVGRRNFQANNLAGEFLEGFVQIGGFSVKDFAAHLGGQQITILHSDIQGFEGEMIEDCLPLIERRQIDHFMISTHSSDLHRTIEKKLSDMGYRVEVSSDFDDHSTSYDGLIYASSPHIPPTFTDFKPFGRAEIGHATGLEKAKYVSAVAEMIRRGKA
jgi:hypothetical protein